MKKPRSAGLAGVDGEHKAHAIRLRKGESNRLTVRWEQVIASSFTGMVTGGCPELAGQLQIKPKSGRAQDPFSQSRNALRLAFSCAAPGPIRPLIGRFKKTSTNGPKNQAQLVCCEYPRILPRASSPTENWAHWRFPGDLG